MSVIRLFLVAGLFATVACNAEPDPTLFQPMPQSWWLDQYAPSLEQEFSQQVMAAGIIQPNTPPELLIPSNWPPPGPPDSPGVPPTSESPGGTGSPPSDDPADAPPTAPPSQPVNPPNLDPRALGDWGQPSAFDGEWYLYLANNPGSDFCFTIENGHVVASTMGCDAEFAVVILDAPPIIVDPAQQQFWVQFTWGTSENSQIPVATTFEGKMNSEGAFEGILWLFITDGFNEANMYATAVVVPI